MALHSDDKDLCLARHGEVSRAMRNRCIELCLLDQLLREDPGKAGRIGELEPTDDLIMCLASQGVPGSTVPQAMVQAHLEILNHTASMHE
jgi:hypothetical protein